MYPKQRDDDPPHEDYDDTVRHRLSTREGKVDEYVRKCAQLLFNSALRVGPCDESAESESDFLYVWPEWGYALYEHQTASGTVLFQPLTIKEYPATRWHPEETDYTNPGRSTPYLSEAVGDLMRRYVYRETCAMPLPEGLFDPDEYLTVPEE